jgi:D-3-phosphoglycerate dehydrogenase
MRVLVADRVPGLVDQFQAAGHDCIVDGDLTAESLPDRLSGIEVLVVRGTGVTAAAIDRADALRLVVRAGSGTNAIDCAAATRHGVLVANTPGRNAIAVAELTMALLLCVDRAVPDNVIELRAGHWDKRRFSRLGRGLYGRRLAVVGLGHIGLEVAARAKAFGMDLHALSSETRSAATHRRVEELDIELAPSIVELAARVDALTLHVPLTAETEGLVDGPVLDALAPGILINTARAGVVDAEALLAHLDRGTLSAGLDVYPDEPADGSASWTSALASHSRVVGTHHIGASTEQAQAAVLAGVLDIVAAYAAGEPVDAVNAAALADLDHVAKPAAAQR